MRSQNDYMDYVKIRYLNGTYFYLSQGLMMAYSTDLKLWDAISIPNLYFYDCFYNSSNEYYYFITNCEDVYKTKRYEYDTATYFQLPYAYAEHSKFSNPKIRKWIRVR